MKQTLEDVLLNVINGERGQFSSNVFQCIGANWLKKVPRKRNSLKICPLTIALTNYHHHFASTFVLSVFFFQLFVYLVVVLQTNFSQCNFVASITKTIFHQNHVFFTLSISPLCFVHVSSGLCWWCFWPSSNFFEHVPLNGPACSSF